MKLHPQALVDPGAIVGVGTRVWAFAHVCSGAVIGEDCNLCDHTFFEKGVKVGNRVTIKCGVYLWDGVTVEDDVHIGPCVTFTNDLRPRSKQPYQGRETQLKTGCSIGANATLLPVTIGRFAMVGAGSVVTRDVPEYALAVGHPARLVGWICRCGSKLSFDDSNIVECACGRSFEMCAPNQIKETSKK